MLAGLLALGIAFQQTKASNFIASHIINWTHGMPTLTVMIGLYIFTTVITEFISNNASVILLIPIVIDLAVQSNVNIYYYVLPVMFAASTSFLSPVGYQTNTMVYSSGVYKFYDFFRVGALLNLILAFVTPMVIKWLWTGV